MNVVVRYGFFSSYASFSCPLSHPRVVGASDFGHPNKPRHAHGTAVRHRFGLEAAQVVLGHERADVPQVYAERNLTLATRVAADIG